MLIATFGDTTLASSLLDQKLSDIRILREFETGGPGTLTEIGGRLPGGGCTPRNLFTRLTTMTRLQLLERENRITHQGRCVPYFLTARGRAFLALWPLPPAPHLTAESPRAHADLKLSEVVALREIESGGPASVTELGRRLGKKKQEHSTLFNRLLNMTDLRQLRFEDLVTDSGRSVPYSITEEGRALLEAWPLPPDLDPKAWVDKLMTFE